MPWIFSPPGSKNLSDCHPYEDQSTYINLIPNLIETHGIIILHDQEPFSREYALNIYRNDCYQRKKDEQWLKTNEQELFLNRWYTCSWPIFCHSEKNSEDIQWLNDLGVIDCYYFYHGLVARDWYRHWKHHGDLSDKSQRSQRFLLYARDCTGTREYRKKVLECLQPLKHQIKSNWAKDPSVGSDFSAKIVPEDALSTGIHLVLETLFVESKIHVTEKTFKPMVMMQPFIIFSGPGTLKYLKSYGFQTFGEVWDESYDEESDPEKRLEKIIGVIKRLSEMNEDEFNAIIDRAQHIVKHNQQHFFSEKFEKTLLDELHHNVGDAISEQRRRLSSDPGGSWFWMYDQLHQHEPSVNKEVHRKMDYLIGQLKTKDPERYLKIKQQYHWVW